MMLTRAVDNHLAYISDLPALVLRTRPETLRSSETIGLDTVLQHDTMDELVSELSEKRVNQLSYEGMRDLSTYLADRLGPILF